MIFPKVLIISIDPFNRVDATGITLSNLFAGWDKNCIAQIYLSDLKSEDDVCCNFYKLNPKIAIVDYWARKLLSTVLKKRRNKIPSAAVSLSGKDKNLRNRFHLQMRAIADLNPIQLDRSLFKWIKTFNPDLIYSSLGNCRMLEITNCIAEKIKKPIVPHFMDDWPNTLYTQHELFGIARKNFKRKFNLMLQNSNGGMCISEPMVIEYKKRYHRPFFEFVNCVDDSLFSKPMEHKATNEDYMFMFIGGLHLNRWKSLLDISEAIEQIELNEKKVSLDIYCPVSDIQLYSQYFKTFTSTHFRGSISSSDVPSKLKKATVLIHVECFDDNYSKYTMFSLSTKIPQYMAAGKPILGYGPIALASMQQIFISGSGKVVSENNVEFLKTEIIDLLKNEKLLVKSSLNAYLYAKTFYSKSSNLKRLFKVLQGFIKEEGIVKL